MPARERGWRIASRTLVGAVVASLLLAIAPLSQAAQNEPATQDELARLAAAQRALPPPDYAALLVTRTDARAPGASLVDTSSAIGHATVATLREDGTFLIGCSESGPPESHDHDHPTASDPTPGPQP